MKLINKFNNYKKEDYKLIFQRNEWLNYYAYINFNICHLLTTTNNNKGINIKYPVYEKNLCTKVATKMVNI